MGTRHSNLFDESKGILAFETLTGRKAYKQSLLLNQSPLELIVEGQRPTFEQEDWEAIPKQLIKLIQLCW